MSTSEKMAAELKPWERRGPRENAGISLRYLALGLCGLLLGCLFVAVGTPAGAGAGILVGILVTLIANLVLGLFFLWICGHRFTQAGCRIAFYSFTAPTWLFLLWLAIHFTHSKL